MVWVDSLYFGKFVAAPLNIILYNIFTSHGPNLYGTEPFSYYIVNGFLNFNFVFIGALFAPFGLVRILTVYSYFAYTECLESRALFVNYKYSLANFN